MMRKNASGIKRYPHAVLRKKADEVASVSDEEVKLIEYMVATMYVHHGIGLAAPQIGVSRRIITVDAGTGLLKMVNPCITAREGMATMEEGCLSVPGRLVEIRRAEKISVTYLDGECRKKAQDFDGLTARAIQHEIDHLDGKLIIDYLPWYKRLLPKKGEGVCLQ
jgi:peptide deformylase